MEGGLRKEGKTSKIMTLIKNSEFTGSCSEGLVRCSNPNKENTVTSDEDGPCCAHPGGSGDLRTEVCPPSPGSTDGVTGNESQLPAAEGSKGLVQGVDVSPGSWQDAKENHNAGVSESTAESQRETSSLHIDAPLPHLARQQDTECRTMSSSQSSSNDEEIARKGREEGRVDVVFTGTVTQDGCCRFVCELLKCVLYQRQQLPMTYDQMVFFQKQQHTSVQSEDTVVKKAPKSSGGLNQHRCQRTLQELDNVLGNLEALFSLSQVPRVLFMLGGSAVLPTELYEVNMEALVVGGGERTLRTSSCLRQIFRAVFVADLLSDVKPVRLMTTTIMALAHRDCGVGWFKPKVDFKVPTRVKKQVISLACDTSLSGQAKSATRDWEDYIWFQAPVTVKGFCK
ncbi:hypothetical protein NFI96_024847 [Prochilodus magdalenae]|nr:hypothetical protein NFI96_024847 [Prochilodus magdalenae]